jgi:pimeloyl-ACP methyl ester carboxylesterase
VRGQSEAPFARPYPLRARPDVPTRFLVCTEDRFFPADFLRRVARERLGIEPDEITSGHCPALAHPDELVAWLESCRVQVEASSSPRRPRFQ